jgi:hypothetical protein
MKEFRPQDVSHSLRRFVDLFRLHEFLIAIPVRVRSGGQGLVVVVAAAQPRGRTRR